MARTDALRREAYLARFAWHMQDYPQRDYRRIRDDLRREIDAAAADVGMRPRCATWATRTRSRGATTPSSAGPSPAGRPARSREPASWS